MEHMNTRESGLLLREEKCLKKVYQISDTNKYTKVFQTIAESAIKNMNWADHSFHFRGLPLDWSLARWLIEAHRFCKPTATCCWKEQRFCLTSVDLV